MSRGGSGFQVYFAPSTDQALRRFYTASGRDEVNKWLNRFLRGEVAFVRNFVRKNARIRDRSGRLRKGLTALQSTFRGIPSLLIGVFSGQAAAYAGTYNYGTSGLNPASPIKTIVPRTSSALAYAPPGSPALDRNGEPAYDSPRQFPDKLTKINFGAGGRTIAGLYRTTDLRMAGKAHLSLSSLQAVYLLMRDVEIPPSNFLDDVVDDLIKELYQHLGDSLLEYLGGAFGGGFGEGLGDYAAEGAD